MSNRTQCVSGRVYSRRTARLILSDAVIAVVSMWLAFLLRFDGRPPPTLGATMMLFAPIALAILVPLSVATGSYGGVPQYASLRDMVRLAGVVAATVLGLTAATMVHYALTSRRPLPLSVPLIWGPILFLGMGASRVFGRVKTQLLAGRLAPAQADRVLIVGAGDAGEHVARDMLRHASRKLFPVGFLDDDPRKIGRKIHGVPVLGPIADLPSAVSQTKADFALIALPSAPSRVIQLVLKLVAQAGTKAKTLPGLGELTNTAATSLNIRDVDVSDLIGRRRVEIDAKRVAKILDGKTVLITGAAGSIGSELARQALRFTPSKLLLLDHNETDLFLLAERLTALAKPKSTEVEMLIADIRDRRRIDAIFDEFKPALVLHAAAYKHVPVMELHPAEAVLTNVTGTRNVAEAACRNAAERFVFVSTDKAVKPTSVMGATKRAAEIVLSGLEPQAPATALASVRFGNVFASRGSVVPLFLEQVRQGGPITVSHPDATRYFMTIDEAAALIWQAGAIARGGETFVLDMGEPVRIMDLAERMRDLFGDDRAKIEIAVTGLRKGEKLSEDLWQKGETLLGRVQKGIFRARPAAADVDIAEILPAIRRVEQMAGERISEAALRNNLFRIVSVKPDPELLVP